MCLLFHALTPSVVAKPATEITVWTSTHIRRIYVDVIDYTCTKLEAS